jgi:hypothetical protein
MPPLETSPYQLLVEGRDDQHSVVHLLRRHGYDWDDTSISRPYVAPKDGFDELLAAVPVAVKGPYDRIGVIIDANTSLADRWAQIRGRMTPTGVVLPPTPDPNGTIVNGTRAESLIGFWLMPDNQTAGRLEDFLRRLVPETDTTWPFADEVVDAARRRGARCRKADHIKSVIHTWLAWQEEPGLPLGTAIRAHSFLHDTEEAHRFVSWFRRLFVTA